jgi:hypothetical protein
LKNAYNPKPWLTTAIRISCANKRKLYLIYRNSNNPIRKEYYKLYYQILSKVIVSAKKKLYYNELKVKSNNKTKTTWNIVKTITNNNTINDITTLNINNKLSSSPLTTANAFITCFSSAAESLLIKNFSGKNTTNNYDPLTYL